MVECAGDAVRIRQSAATARGIAIRNAGRSWEVPAAAMLSSMLERLDLAKRDLVEHRKNSPAPSRRSSYDGFAREVRSHSLGKTFAPNVHEPFPLSYSNL